MKSYQQYCSVARALDIVGDRWVLLIVRELLAFGPSRYSDLQRGLPGVASNLLAERLRVMEADGLIERYEAPAPVGANLYRLTERGRGLQDVVHALSRWGLDLMPAGATAGRRGAAAVDCAVCRNGTVAAVAQEAEVVSVSRRAGSGAGHPAARRVRSPSRDVPGCRRHGLGAGHAGRRGPDRIAEPEAGRRPRRRDHGRAVRPHRSSRPRRSAQGGKARSDMTYAETDLVAAIERLSGGDVAA